MSSSFDPTKTLFSLSITLSAFSSGLIFGMTAVAVPSFLAGANHPTIPSQSSAMTRSSPHPSDDRAARETSLILTQWRKLYHIGHYMGPGLFSSASLCYLANAWWHYYPTATAAGNAVGGAWGTRRSLWFLAAAVVNMSIVPFTVLNMVGMNTELHRREEAGRGVKEEWTKGDPEGKLKAEGSSEEIMRRWGVYNAVRSCFPLVAVWCGFQALS